MKRNILIHVEYLYYEKFQFHFHQINVEQEWASAIFVLQPIESTIGTKKNRISIFE